MSDSEYLVDIKPAIDYLVEYYKQETLPELYGTFEGVCKLYGNFSSITHIQDFFNDLQKAQLKRQTLIITVDANTIVEKKSDTS